MNWLMPKEKKLLEMLHQQSEIVLESANGLKIYVSEFQKLERSERKAKAYSFKEPQKKADELRIKILQKINKGFANKNDKEFIRGIAVLLHDIADLMEKTALRFVLLSIERIDDFVIKLADVILNVINELNNCILNLKKAKEIEECLLKLKNSVRDADEMLNEALSELFHFYKNSLDIIKYNEIYKFFGEIVCKCEDAGNVIRLLADKNS